MAISMMLSTGRSNALKRIDTIDAKKEERDKLKRDKAQYFLDRGKVTIIKGPCHSVKEIKDRK